MQQRINVLFCSVLMPHYSYSGALYLIVFEQPASKAFFGILLENISAASERK